MNGLSYTRLNETLIRNMLNLTAVLVSSILIEKDSKWLFLNEENSAGFLELNLPGGHVEIGETVFQAAIREAKEETGYEIEILGLLGILQVTRRQRHAARYIWKAKIIGGEPKAEAGSVMIWMTEEEYRKTELLKHNRLDDVMAISMKNKLIDPELVPSLDISQTE